MNATYWQKGEKLDYHNSTESVISAGEIINLTTRIGVAGTDIAAGEIGTVVVTGVFEITKVDETEITIGTAVYLTDTGITATAGTNTPAGYAAATAAASDTTILVKLLG